MSLLAGVLLAELADDELRALAERLQPYLSPQPAAADIWLDGIEAIARYLGCPTSRLYDPTYRRRSGIPLYKDGRSWVALRSELDRWRRAPS